MRRSHGSRLFFSAAFLFSFAACLPPETIDPFAGIGYRDMIQVTGGTYTQGNSGESFSHTVSTFNLGKYEVTYELWYTVSQWALSHEYHFQLDEGTEGNDGTAGAAPTTAKAEPVCRVSWRAAMVWCNAYSEMAGFAPCYSYGGNTIRDARDANATACDSAVCAWSNNGYRLPSEGEWQFAASNKGGTPWDYASGAAADYTDAAESGLVAWYNLNSGGPTHNVGTTANPSALTFRDLSGNVMEWCWDWIEAYPGATTDYRGAASGTNRIQRGGSYTDINVHLRNGNRSTNPPDSNYSNCGLRVARSY